ncbi:unnamed protein product, partial [Ixodes pacificus]
QKREGTRPHQRPNPRDALGRKEELLSWLSFSSNSVSWFWSSLGGVSLHASGFTSASYLYG